MFFRSQRWTFSDSSSSYLARLGVLDEAFLCHFQVELPVLLDQTDLLALELKRFGERELFLTAPFEKVIELFLLVVLTAGKKNIVNVDDANGKELVSLTLVKQEVVKAMLCKVDSLEAPAYFTVPCSWC